MRLCPWPWSRAFLSLASRVSVLGNTVLGLGLGFFLCRWPWPRALCPRLHFWTAVSKFEITLFTDDTNLQLFHKNIATPQSQVEEEINKINKWMNLNKLTINYKKAVT